MSIETSRARPLLFLVSVLALATQGCAAIAPSSEGDGDAPATSEAAAALTGYDQYVNHYSDHWPTYYTIAFPTQGGGVHFYARWKWYQGYGSRTVCIESSSCGVGVGECAQEFDLPGSCSYAFNVDGPYQIQVTIGSYANNPFTDSWIR